MTCYVLLMLKTVFTFIYLHYLQHLYIFYLIYKYVIRIGQICIGKIDKYKLPETCNHAPSTNVANHKTGIFDKKIQ